RPDHRARRRVDPHPLHPLLGARGTRRGPRPHRPVQGAAGAGRARPARRAQLPHPGPHHHREPARDDARGRRRRRGRLRVARARASHLRRRARPRLPAAPGGHPARRRDLPARQPRRRPALRQGRPPGAGDRMSAATATPPAAPATGTRPPSRLRSLRALLRRPVAVVGLAVLAAVVLAALLGEQLAPYPANAVDVTRALQPPSGDHLLGTDELGRDVLSRVVLAARVSVQVALVSVSIALVAGVLLGVLAGYFGG